MMASSEELSCPRCQSPLVQKKAPFYLHGEHVGNFESLVCDMCRFSALTSKGYQDATVEAERFGLIGPAEDISSKVKVVMESFAQIDNVFSVQGLQLNKDLVDQVLGKTGETSSAKAITADTKMIVPEYFAKYRKVSRTKYEIPIAPQN